MKYCTTCTTREGGYSSPRPPMPRSKLESLREQRIDLLFGIVEHLTDRVVELERNEEARQSYEAEQNERA